MRITTVKAQNFRNFKFLNVSLPGDAHFIVGDNGQGKTNLLEAVNFMTSLRSFRTSEVRSLIRWDAEPKEAVLFFVITGDHGEDTTLEIRLKSGVKQILLDGNPVARMNEFLGLFPTVAMSSQDIQLLRGTPQLRRRFIDLALAGVDADYYEALRQYYQALKGRNALLKQQARASQLQAFEKQLAPRALEVVARRRVFFESIEPWFRDVYQTISPVAEAPVLEYRPNFNGDSESAFHEQLMDRLEKDRRNGATSIGPHRDDFYFGLQSHRAREYASEGQQRGLVLALRLAQIHWMEDRTGRRPVILADDILGELDAHRRAGFWESVGSRRQVIASGTALPSEDPEHQWKVWRMVDGTVTENEEEGA